MTAIPTSQVFLFVWLLASLLAHEKAQAQVNELRVYIVDLSDSPVADVCLGMKGFGSFECSDQVGQLILVMPGWARVGDQIHLRLVGRSSESWTLFPPTVHLPRIPAREGGSVTLLVFEKDLVLTSLAELNEQLQEMREQFAGLVDFGKSSDARFRSIDESLSTLSESFSSSVSNGSRMLSGDTVSTPVASYEDRDVDRAFDAALLASLQNEPSADSLFNIAIGFAERIYDLSPKTDSDRIRIAQHYGMRAYHNYSTGNAEVARGNYQQALRLLQSPIDSSLYVTYLTNFAVATSDATVFMAQDLRKIRYLREAADSLDAALNIDPENIGTNYNRAIVLSRLYKLTGQPQYLMASIVQAQRVDSRLDSTASNPIARAFAKMNLGAGLGNLALAGHIDGEGLSSRALGVYLAADSILNMHGGPIDRAIVRRNVLHAAVLLAAFSPGDNVHLLNRVLSRTTGLHKWLLELRVPSLAERAATDEAILRASLGQFSEASSLFYWTSRITPRWALPDAALLGACLRSVVALLGGSSELGSDLLGAELRASGFRPWWDGFADRTWLDPIVTWASTRQSDDEERAAYDVIGLCHAGQYWEAWRYLREVNGN